jgi:hypothetical protein
MAELNDDGDIVPTDDAKPAATMSLTPRLGANLTVGD